MKMKTIAHPKLYYVDPTLARFASVVPLGNTINFLL